MPTPLPPIPHGPLFPSSTLVQVSGALPGAKITVFADGVQVGEGPAQSATTWVPLAKKLAPGQAVRATQRTGAGTSEATFLAVPVVELPNPLPMPDFWSPMSVDMSFLLMGQLLPGAELTVTIAGTGVQVAKQIIQRPDEYVALDLTKPLNAGDVLAASQRLAVPGAVPLTSGARTSVPLGPRHGDLRPPQIGDPRLGCSTALRFFGVTGSSEVHVENEGQASWWLGTASAFTGYFAPPLKPGKLVARQAFKRVNLVSEPATFEVANAEVPPPQFRSWVCAESRRFGAYNLVPGAVLQMLAAVSPSSNLSEASPPVAIAEVGVSSAEEYFELPPQAVPHVPAGGSLWLHLAQELCGARSAESNLGYMINPEVGFGPAPRIISAVYDCVGHVLVEMAKSLPTLQVFLQNGTPLSDQITPSSFQQVISLYRPVHTGEVLYVRQWGCALASQSDAVQVRPLPSPMPAPQIQGPPRPGATSVFATGVLPGARVHLYVNDQWRSTVVTYVDTVWFGVDALKEGDRVSVVQTLCTLYSRREDGAVQVVRGNMVVAVTPASVQKGTSQAVTVTARDADTNAEINGAGVLLGGVAVGVTGQPFVFAPPLSPATSASGTVQEPIGHNDATFTIGLTDPPPRRSRATRKLTLNFAGYPVLGGAVDVKEVNWTLTPTWGGKQPVTASGTHTTATVPTPPAGNGEIEVRLDFTVVLDGYVNGRYVHDEVKSHGVAGIDHKYPVRVDLNLAPKGVIGFFAQIEIDAAGVPHFFAVYWGAE